MSQEYIFGIHSVLAALQKSPDKISKLLIQKGQLDKRKQQIHTMAQAAGVPVEFHDKDRLDKMSSGNHQGVLGLWIGSAPSYSESDIPELMANLSRPALILILDGVQDPHNLGACLRTADAAGVDFVIIPKDKAVSVTAAVRKVASGAAETIPVVSVTNLARIMRYLQEQGVWLYGLAGEAEQTLYQTDFTGACALVLGAEGDGMRRLTREHCDALVQIPMAGYVSSVNVSVATAVSLFEVVRQRYHVA